MITPDMSQYRDMFLDEGREQLELLEQNIFEMEASEPTSEMLQTMFRAAHTLKGSGRAMGYEVIGALTHEMENVLDDLRNELLTSSTPIVDALLECLDQLKQMMDTVAETGTDSSAATDAVTALIARLDALRQGGPASPSPAGVSECAAPEGANLQLSISLSPTCMLKSVRTMMVFGALEPFATLVGTSPSQEDIDEERFENEFLIFLETDADPEVIRKEIRGILEIESVVTTVLKQGAAEAVETPLPQSSNLEIVTPQGVLSAESPQADVPRAPIGRQREPKPESQTIRVGVGRLDALLNLVGELVIDRSQIIRHCSDLEAKIGKDTSVGGLQEAIHRIGRITNELQDEIMKTRMLPIDGVFQRMPRMIRDLAQRTGKEVRFEMEGGETELDRSLLDALGDPLIHLLRNSVDHGIEPPEKRVAAGKSREGSVKLRARHQQNHIVIEIIDDGNGMDVDRIKTSAVNKGVLTRAAADAMSEQDAFKLIFASGISTAKEVSDISGRGVGMDIVRSNLEKVGGQIHIQSEIGIGSCFTVQLPLTLAIVRALLVRAEEETYAIPLSAIVETLRLGTDTDSLAPESIGGQAAIVLRGETVPLINLIGLLQQSPDAMSIQAAARSPVVVVVGSAQGRVGLCVDDVKGEQEVVIKSLGKLLGNIPGISGASILGDGGVALIVDAARAVRVAA